MNLLEQHNTAGISKKVILLIFGFNIFFYQILHADRDSTKTITTLSVTSTDSVLYDSTAIHKNIVDTLLQKTDTDSLNMKTFEVDTADKSEQDLLHDQSLLVPSEEDTTNKIRLPVNLKKTKYAYFDASQSINRVIRNNAFEVGEKLTFIIRYGIIVAGSATMGIPEIIDVNGKQAYKIVTKARSGSFFSAFFKVRDNVESLMDKDGLFSWGFKKQLREGRYRSKRSVVYDQINGWAINNKNDSLQIPPCVQDILTSFYYIRTMDIAVGNSKYIDNHADNKLYPLEIKVHKKERIKVKAGTFDCIVVEPIIRASGLFKHKGRLLIWLTDDERRIPVQMKSKVIIGYITAELKKMEGIKKTKHVGLRPN